VAALAGMVSAISELATTTHSHRALKLTLFVARSKCLQKCDSRSRRAGGKLCFYAASPIARLKIVPHPSLAGSAGPKLRCSVETPIDAFEQRRVGQYTVRAVKRVQRGQRTVWGGAPLTS
jgi:hypothetical protein